MTPQHEKFLDSLQVGKLVFASSYATQKTHLINCERTAWDADADEIRHRLRRHPSKIDHALATEIAADRRHLWTAIALCGVKSERAHYGNYSSYYWRPQQNPTMERVCKGCMKAWEKLGEPEIQGYDRTARPDDPWPWPLPLAWTEVPATGHPWDAPTPEAAEKIVDDTGRSRGQCRVEMRRWQRGPRIVRLCHHPVTDTYSARYWTADADPDEEHWKVEGTLQYAREYCHKLMATGGY